MTERLRAGIVGIGTMGRIVAARLVAAGYQVLAHDSALPAQAAAQNTGATIVKDLREIGEGVDVILLSLPGPSDVEAVVLGEDGLLQCAVPDQVIVDLSTIDPVTTRRMADKAARRGVEYMDAPILGRPSSAGRWVLPVGGNESALARCRALLETFAVKVIHVGPPGAGHTLKLLNQMMFATINAMTAEMLAVAAKAGIPARLLVETIASSGAATVSPLFCEVGDKIARGDFQPIFPIDLLCKDTRLAIQMAQRAGAPPIITGTVQILNEIAQARGYGTLDTGALIKVYEGILGVSVHDTGRNGDSSSQ